MAYLLEYHETPVVEIRHPLIEKNGIQLFVKREDLNHRFISGNKWWKLKYNLQAAAEAGYKRLLTFGGAYSNHIYATAAACREYGLDSVGVVRGEGQPTLSPTLAFARSQGMHLHFVTRSEYRQKTDPAFLSTLEERFGKCFVVPEGGTNIHGIHGAEDFVDEIRSLPFDTIFVPVGTGGTICGIIAGLDGRKEIVGVPVLKPGDFLRQEIASYLQMYCNNQFSNWSLLTDYHHGGYAKISSELVAFMGMMRTECNLPLDHVYTGKLLFAVFREIEKLVYKRGTTILAVHTGGLQGTIAT